MRISLALAKEQLSHTAPADRLEQRISRVCEKLINSGKWNGSIHNIALLARYGQVALPRQYQSIQGVKIDGVVRQLTNSWYTYLPGKSDYGFSMMNVENLGDSKATLYGLPIGGRGYTSAPTATVVGDGTGATVRLSVVDGSISGIDVDEPGTGYTVATIVFTGGDPGIPAQAVVTLGVGGNGGLENVKLIAGGVLSLSGSVVDELVVTLYGTDENFLPVELTITGVSAVANPFVHIDRVHREQGTSSITLRHTQSVFGGAQIPLAMLAPREEEVYLRRYFVRTLVNKPEATILALARLRFVPFTSDQDILPFSSLAALEAAMRGEQYESENDLTLAAVYYNTAYKILNDELKSGKAVDESPVIRFIYAPGTIPKFTSRY